MYTTTSVPTDGTVGPFAIGFNYLAGSTISVTRVDSDGVSNPVSLAFTFSGAKSEAQPSGTTVTLNASQAAGKFLIIKKTISLTAPALLWSIGAEINQKNLRANTTNMMEMAQQAADISEEAKAEAAAAKTAAEDAVATLDAEIAGVQGTVDAAVASATADAAASAASAGTSAGAAASSAASAAGSASTATAQATLAGTAKTAAEAAQAASEAAQAAAEAAATVATGGINDADLVHRTGDESIDGLKTFLKKLILSAGLDFSGTGGRITGDFSNATIANRVYVQTSTSGGNTSFSLLPHPANATPITSFEACLSSDPANATLLQAQITTTDARLNSGARGTGGYLPLTFYTGGSERMRIDTSGNVGLGVTTPLYRLDLAADGNAYAINARGRASDGNALVRLADNSNAWRGHIESTASALNILTGVSLTLGAGGNVVKLDGAALAVVTPIGLGYGTGAGGSVFQPGTSGKSSAVTLNKPTGKISTDAASLAAGAQVAFAVNNNLVVAGDTVSVVVESGPASLTAYSVRPTHVNTGIFYIVIKNESGGALAEALVLRFNVHKGSAA